MSVFTKLLAVQGELKAPKGQFNSFGKYNYRNCEDILEAVKPLLAKQGVSLVLTDEIVLIGERYYVKATARFIDETSGEETDVCAFAREEETKKGMDGSQITGASSSYARKYALNGLFCIDDAKDSDTTNKGEETHRPSAAELEGLINALEDKGKSLDKVIAAVNKRFGTSLADLHSVSGEQYAYICAILQKS